MRKLSLLLSLLLSFVSLASLSHASSGDITIGNKAYTQSEAQKQIVEPLIQRIQKQKVAKIKARIVTITIRQYTNRFKTAQKQGKTDLANFYSGVINTLNGKMNTTNTGSTNSTENIASTNTSATQDVVNTYTVNGMTFSLTAEQKKTSEAKVMSIKSGFCGDKGDFLILIKQKGYANISYEYHFASTLSYQEYINGKMTCSVPYNANHGGLGTTSNQTGLTDTISTVNTGAGLNSGAGIGGNGTNDYNGMTQTEKEHAMIEQQVNGDYENAITMGLMKSQFLSYMKEDYGTGYGYQYAQKLPFPSDEIQQKKMNEYKVKEQAKKLVDEKYQSVYIANLKKGQKEARRIFLAEIQKLYGTNSYSYQYAGSISVSMN